MDRKLTMLALACAAALSFTAAAQTTATPSSTPTQTSPTSTMPTTPVSPTSPASPTSPTTNPSGLTPPPGTANPTASMATSPNNQMFASLDRTKKGYLTQSDVASNQYLSTNFQRCDKNSDTRLSESEVSTCLQGAPQSR